MTVWAIGLNHTTAPLDLRSRFAFPADQLVGAVGGLKRALMAQRAPASTPVEAAILSTCNRTEIYLADAPASEGGPADMAQVATHWLARQGGVAQEQLREHIYRMHHAEAARHVFRVASGLDSMVLGEPQILGQFKDAVRVAEEAGALGSTLHQLFQRGFAVAKDVRTQTELGSASISMAAAAVRLAAQLFEDLSKTKVLLVGAGEMIELAATHFAGRKPLSMCVANRSMERGMALAERFNADVPTATMRLAELPERLHEFDIVVSCTASTLPIIGLGAVERAVKLRRHRPVFMVDLAVPRDIEPEVKALDDVYLYTVDDLAGIVNQGRAARQSAVVQAEGIVSAGVDGFMQWVRQRDALPLIAQLNERAALWREQELDRARKALARGDAPEAVLEQLAKAVTAKALHGAYVGLASGEPAEREAAARAVAQLFLKP